MLRDIFYTIAAWALPVLIIISAGYVFVDILKYDIQVLRKWYNRKRQ